MNKIAFISDIHGNIDALRITLQDIKSRKISKIVCLGDVASYNAEPEACYKLLSENPDIVWIAGNHDLMAANLLEPINCSPKALYAALRARKHLPSEWRHHIQRLPLTYHDQDIYAFHASPAKVDEYLSSEQRITRAIDFLREQNIDAKYIFFGHTHNSVVYHYHHGLTVSRDNIVMLQRDGTYMINVGTVGEPRSEHKIIEYCVFDRDQLQIEFIQLHYDHAASYARSIKQKSRIYNQYILYYYSIVHFLFRVKRKLVAVDDDHSTLAKVSTRMEHSKSKVK
ncbi:MAG: metallophosphoesterase [Gammaproteobacteria bacterium]|nr:metallophosphoesterase [Gammaproteobacteria bacterium]